MTSTLAPFTHDDCASKRRVVPCSVAACGRVELKYSVPVGVAEAALDVARDHLPPDPLALGSQQRVTSLYLDTPRLTFLRWHRDRALDRFKLRIRRYGDQLGSTFYAEVKRKTGPRVRKCRASFPAESLAPLCEGFHPEHPLAPGENVDNNLREFVLRQRIFGATPKMLITGLRESLRDPESGAAVTVDCDLQYQPVIRADLTGGRRAWQKLALPSSPQNVLLVELKYSDRPPYWMAMLIRRLATWRVSFSKYATAMDQWRSTEVA